MILKDVIERLKNEPQDNVIKNGWGHAMSYRGYYEELAFSPANNVTIGSMLKEAEKALNNTYEGYKGGDFTMDEYTNVHIAKYGQTGHELSEMLLNYILADVINNE